MNRIIFMFLLMIFSLSAQSQSIVSEIENFKSSISKKQSNYKKHIIQKSNKLTSRFSNQKAVAKKQLRNNQITLNSLYSSFNGIKVKSDGVLKITKNIKSLMRSHIKVLTNFDMSLLNNKKVPAALKQKSFIAKEPRAVLVTKKEVPVKAEMLGISTNNINQNLAQPKMSLIQFFDNYGLQLLMLALAIAAFFGIGKIAKALIANKKTAAPSLESQLGPLGELTMPAIILGKNEIVLWANKKAARNLGLNKNILFSTDNDLKKEQNSLVFINKNDKYLVTKQELFINRESVSLLLFQKLSTVVENKSFKLTHSSRNLDAILASALEKYNYLFTASSIPVCIDSENDIALDKKHSPLIETLVYLSYLMGKDCSDPRINLICGANRYHHYLQIDIRNLVKNEIDLNKEILIPGSATKTLADALSEVELRLSSYGGRILLYNKEQSSTPYTTIAVEFDRHQNESYLLGDQSDEIQKFIF